ncbi:MAG: aminotransferase class I/II-fold pyridoxal phosphate-dependent enzyme [Bacillota bacterium]|nr:aminotransferase class I/II-fold pyridoxal phosphate-dependent enzyme [Bacillota bacterium]
MSLKESIDKRVQHVNMPENLAVGMMVRDQRNRCQDLQCPFDYFAFAFGESPFQVPKELSHALAENSAVGGYTEPGGIEQLKSVTADFYNRHFDLNIESNRVIIGPGTKSLFYMIFSMLALDYIIPVPSWIGYTPQLDLLSRKWHTIDLLPDNNYKLQPEQLEHFLAKHPDKAFTLILNSPHNPTGQVYDKFELEALAAVCRRHEVIVLSDEIYSLTTYDIKSYASMAAVYPEGTLLTGGLSKDRSSGGYRLGVVVLPEKCPEELHFGLEKIAATIYTNVTTPVQYAAVKAYTSSSEMDEYLQVTRSIHALIGQKLSERFARIPGLNVTEPKGGFYFLADFNQLGEVIHEKGIDCANELSKALIAHPHHIAVVTGDSLVVKPDNYCARIAFVDYDGPAAYEDYLQNPPSGEQGKEKFFNKHASRMLKGADALEKFLNS